MKPWSARFKHMVIYTQGRYCFFEIQIIFKNKALTSSVFQYILETPVHNTKSLYLILNYPPPSYIYFKLSPFKFCNTFIILSNTSSVVVFIRHRVICRLHNIVLVVFFSLPPPFLQVHINVHCTFSAFSYSSVCFTSCVNVLLLIFNELKYK